MAARRWWRRPGPVANFVLAIVLFTGLILHSGHTVVAPVIGDVVQGQRRRKPPASRPATASPRLTAPAITDFEQLPEIIVGQRRPDPHHRPDPRPARPLTVHVMPHACADARRSGRHGRHRGDRGAPVRQPHRSRPSHYSVPGAFGAACGETWDIVQHHGPGHRPDGAGLCQRRPVPGAPGDRQNDAPGGGCSAFWRFSIWRLYFP